MTSTGIYNIVTTSIGEYWNSKDIVRAWFGVATSANGKKMIACLHGGGYQLYTSIDSGNTWTINTNLQTGDYTSVSSSADGSILLTGSYGGYLYVSTNSGLTWTQRTANGARTWWKTGVSSNGTVMVGCPTSSGDGKLYVSTDTGLTWTARITDAARDWRVAPAFSLDGTKILVADQSAYLWISTDTGTTWSSRLTDSTRTWSGVASSADGTKLAACNGNGQIWTSINSGTTWTTRGPFVSWTGIVSLSDGTTLAACSTGYIYISTDSGVNWTTRASSRSWNCIAASSDLTTLVSTIENGNIWTSNIKVLIDIGTYLQPYTTGTQMTTGINILNSIKNTGGPNSGSPAGSVMSYDGTKIIVAVESSSVIYVSTNTGGTWTTYAIGATLNWRGLSGSSTLDNLLLTPGYPGQVNPYLSTSLGKTWVAGTFSFVTRPGGNASSADGTKLLVVTQDGGKIYTSTNSGVTWTVRLTSVSGNWYGAASSADGNKLTAVMYSGYIWTSTDAGISWTQRLTSIGGSWDCCGSSADGSVLAVGGTNLFYTSIDSGLTWTPFTPMSKQWNGVAVSGDGNTIVAVNSTEGILYLSSNKGVTWKQISMAYSLGWDVAISYDGNIVSVTANNGVYILRVKNDLGTLFNPYTSGVQKNIGLSSIQINNSIFGVNWTTRLTDILRKWNGAVAISNNGQNIFAVSANSQDNYGYISINSGATWTKITTLPNSGFSGAVVSGDFQKLAASTFGTMIYTSNDQGITWKTNSIGSSFFSLAGSNDGTVLIGPTSSSTVYVSVNFGVTWSSYLLTDTLYCAASSSNGSKIAVAGTNSAIYVSTNFGGNWTKLTNVPGGQTWRGITISDDGTKLVAAGGNGLYTSTNSGVGWTLTKSGGNFQVASSSSDGKYIIAGPYGSNLFISSDSGMTWIARGANTRWTACAITRNGSTMVAAADNEYIYTSYSGYYPDIGALFQNL